MTVEERQVGRTTFEKLELDARDRRAASRPSSTTLAQAADPDLVLDVRLVGVRPDELDLDVDEVEAALAAVVPQGPRPRRSAARPDRGRPAVARHDRRRVHPRPRGADRRARGRPARPPSADAAAELRDALRLGRLLLAGHEVTL